MHRSVYSLGASDGFWVGLSMGVCIMCMVASYHHPWLGMIGLLLIIATPFMAWWFLRRAWVNARVPATFSAVWLHGICIFLFGGIIMSLLMYVALRFLEPGWIENQTMLAAQRLAEDTQTVEQAKILTKIVESGQLPSPIYTAVSSIWLVAFTGSMWSMIFAFILTRFRRYTRLRVEYVENKIENGF